MVLSPMRTVVRAYDLGGFGDIAGAMRVASFLQRTGVDVKIRATSPSAHNKLNLLKPDVPVIPPGEAPSNSAIQVDVAGHYGDDRNEKSTDVPHHYTEDMDNPEDRQKAAPIYMKTGLTTGSPVVPLRFNGHDFRPMFYRPFREWDLPKPGKRDARRQIVKAYAGKKWAPLYPFTKLARTINQMERIGFAHLSPAIQQISGEDLLEHPYFYAVHTASVNRDEQYGLGLFVGKDVEYKLAKAALRKHWGVITSDGNIIKNDPQLPTLMFLGPQQQTTTTGLFLSSDIPNLVTGDLSLSEALYALIAMEGKGFFYETPPWKLPTLLELNSIIHRHHTGAADVQCVGSNFVKVKPEQRDVYDRAMRMCIGVFMHEKESNAYTRLMRDAVRAEIQRRFPGAVVEPQPYDGFHIPPGAPYLLEDATAEVVQHLRDDTGAFTEAEGVRKMLANGVPVTVNVVTGVLEPKPATEPVPHLYEPVMLKYGKKNVLESIVEQYSLKAFTYGQTKKGIESYVEELTKLNYTGSYGKKGEYSGQDIYSVLNKGKTLESYLKQCG